MKPTPELLNVARRVLWNDPPEEALKNKIRFLHHVMIYGSKQDIGLTKWFYSNDDFIDALHNAPPGLFGKQSWELWHLKMGINPIPPLPTRPCAPDGYQPTWPD